MTYGVLGDGGRVVIYECAERESPHEFAIGVIDEHRGDAKIRVDAFELRFFRKADEHAIEISCIIQAFDREPAAVSHEFHVPVVPFAQKSVYAVQFFAPCCAVERQSNKYTKEALSHNARDYIIER